MRQDLPYRAYRFMEQLKGNIRPMKVHVKCEYPLISLSRIEQERVATVLSGLAADILKGECRGTDFILEIEEDKSN